MSKIRIFIVDDHQVVCDGIKALLSDVEDIEVLGCATNTVSLIEKIRGAYIHISLINIYNPTDIEIENIRKLKSEYPNMNLLILSMSKSKSFILKSLKAGARGYLTKDTNRSEITEAIYTIRGGYDYYAKSITNIILNNYLKETDPELLLIDQEEKRLSIREIEVLKLFGQSLTNKEIADRLFISVRTVESHKNNVMKKLNLRTTVDLVKFAITNNIIEF
ncbi:MAG: response regulator transcription factor [Bacteroidetes bacterium]|nr:response regulator transcription factor [Bacteroidota bacterium]